MEPPAASEESIESPEPIETAEPVMPDEITEEEAPAEDTTIVLSNIWDIMDNDEVEEIELLKGLEVADIDAWQKDSHYSEIKLYQRTILEPLRLGTCGDIAVAQFVTNPDVYQTKYDYSSDPVWNVRMEKSDCLKNNTDGWKICPTDPYCISTADGKYKLNKDHFIWGVVRPE